MAVVDLASQPTGQVARPQNMEFNTVIPFVHRLGFELLSWDAGQAQIAVDLREDLMNNLNVVHGGVSMTLLDVAMAHAARSPNQPGHAHSPRVVTVEMKTNFLRPGTGRLVAHGRLVHRTSTLAFCDGTILDHDDAIVATASGTFKYLKISPYDGIATPHSAAKKASLG